MKIQLIKNDGPGFAEFIEVPNLSTVDDVFTAQMNGQSKDKFMVRVNRENVSGDTALEEGDRVTITPTNIEGA